MTETHPHAARYLIRGGRLRGTDPIDLLLGEGRVLARSDTDSAIASAGARVIDADGLIVLPGLVDVHTHLREPGAEEAETIATGAAAAARGGFTAVHAMANTNPVADTAALVEHVYQRGRQAGWAEVRPVGAVTRGLAGQQLAELGGMADSQARVRIFSDDGHCVSDPALMRRALEYVSRWDGVIAQHAQDPQLTAGALMHEGAVSDELGMPGWPAVGEEAVIARDVLLAHHTGSRVHICHVSTAGSVEILRWAKARGYPVTAEVAPHHLLLTDERVRSFDPVFKVNPPLRRAEDVHALRQGLVDGTIDIVATDHAPHPPETKERPWAHASMGMTGLETALSVLVRTMVEPGLLDWAQLAEVMSTRPAAIARLPWQGGALATGEPANLVLVDPAASWRPGPATQVTKGRNCPFTGEELPARVQATFWGGRPTVLDGELAEPRAMSVRGS